MKAEYHSDMAKFSLARLMAGGMLLERVHSTLMQHSESYKAAVKSGTNRIKKKLRLQRTYRDEINNFVGSTDVIQSDYQTPGNYHADWVVKEINNFDIEKKMYIGEYTLADMLDSFGNTLKGLNTDIVRHDFVPGSYAAGWCRPDEIPDQLLTPEEQVTEYKAIFSYLIFARIDGIPFVCLPSRTKMSLEKGGFTPWHTVSMFYARENRETICDKFSLWVSEKIYKINPIYKTVAFFSKNSDDEAKLLIDGKKTLKFRYEQKSFNRKLFTSETLALFDDLTSFTDKQQSITDRGMDGRRAYLMAGPPGTGKSNVIEALCRCLPDQYTAIIIQPDMIPHLHELTCFKFSYIKFPFLIIEDIDLILEYDEDKQHLLNFLDGLNSPKNLITVMTTNRPETLSDNLIRRPGRIDRICKIMPGDYNVRKEQIKLLNTGLKVPEIDIASMTDGFSFAQLRELIRRAEILSINLGTIDEASFLKSLKECKTQFAGEFDEWSKLNINWQNATDKAEGLA